MVRLFFGFAAAALWLPILLFFANTYYGAFAFVMISTFTVPLTLFVAAPLYYCSRREVDLWLCMLFGVYIGGFGSVIILAMSSFTATFSLYPVLIGWLSAIVFWVVGLWKNKNAR